MEIRESRYLNVEDFLPIRKFLWKKNDEITVLLLPKISIINVGFVLH